MYFKYLYVFIHRVMNQSLLVAKMQICTYEQEKMANFISSVLWVGPTCDVTQGLK